MKRDNSDNNLIVTIVLLTIAVFGMFFSPWLAGFIVLLAYLNWRDM